MKYIILLSDGMAGRPLSELSGRTTVEAAHTPVMDTLAKVSEIGMTSMVPKGMAPGSDTANLAVMGYDPKKYYTGRSPLEALSIGVDMAEVLLSAVKERLVKEGYQFYTGTSYRHLLIWKGGRVLELTPPHDILTKKIGSYLPKDPVLREMMEKSYEILEHHPINENRRKNGLKPANSLWFWGAGTKPALTSFEERTGKKGVMISAVDLLKGIAIGAGMDCVCVEGANGGLHTNYKGKALAAVQALTEDGYDFAYIHVEAPDEMGHQGSAAHKIEAIEHVDKEVLGTVAEKLNQAGEDYRLLYDSTKEQDGLVAYNEKTAETSGRYEKDGYRLIGHLLQEELC